MCQPLSVVRAMPWPDILALKAYFEYQAELEKKAIDKAKGGPKTWSDRPHDF